jgi:hypothetical protein
MARLKRTGAVAVLLVGIGVASFSLLRTPADTADPASAGTSAPLGDPTPAPSPSPSPSPLLARPLGPLDGYLLIADRGNDRILLVDGRKRVLWSYPPKKGPTFPFHYGDDAFFSPDFSSIISNQEDQQTLEVFSFPGKKVLWHYGHVNVTGSSPGYMHTPDDAYLLKDGTRVVADVANCRVIFVSPGKKITHQFGTTGSCGHDPPRLLGLPNGDTPYSQGRMLVTEISGSWIDALGPRGKLLWSVQAPVVYPSDAQWLGHGKVLLADYSSPGHVLVMKNNGHVLWSYGPSSGPGSLDHPSLALMLPNGLISVNDDFNDRVVIIDPKKDKIVWQYGHTDQPGRQRNHLRIPDGMDFLPYKVALRIPQIRKQISRHQR